MVAKQSVVNRELLYTAQSNLLWDERLYKYDEINQSIVNATSEKDTHLAKPSRWPELKSRYVMKIDNAF